MQNSFVKISALGFISYFFLFCFPAHAAQEIAYSHLTNGYWQIWVMDEDGLNNKQLTYSTTDKRNPAWIENNQKIVYRNNNSQLFIFDVASATEEEIFQRYNNITEPNFCDATHEIVFVRYDPTGMDRNQIWKSDIQGQNFTALTQGVLIKFTPSFSQHGDKIVFARKNDSHVGTSLWMMDADGGNLNMLTPQSEFRDAMPSFSPDEKYVVFASNREGNYDIYILDLATKTFKNITNHLAFDIYPHFSTDGKKIVFASDRSGSRQIWTMNTDGTNLKMLTQQEESAEPTWKK